MNPPRPSRFRPSCILPVLLGLSVSLNADITLAPLFQDHAVLQRNKPVPIWGRAAPGEAVEVRFKAQAIRTVAGNDGRWRVELQPLAASAEPADLLVLGKNTVIVRDILVGDVWLCSGQSNMAWSVGASANPDFEIPAAHWPLIRQIKIWLAVEQTPQDSAEGRWQVCSPCTVATFTAVGYYFAREIHEKLRVPIGIVNSSVGGSSIEAWLSREALASDPAFAVVAERWKKVLAAADLAKTADYDRQIAAWREAVAVAAAARDGRVPPVRPLAPLGPRYFSQPSGLFYGMIAPLAPYALNGFVWYQGEANAGRASEYHRLFTALIDEWRTVFQQGDLPFLFVQLPNYLPNDPTGMTWAEIREAQAQALVRPATGMAVTIDIGLAGNGHPYNKQDVGRRLALLAMKRTHGLAVDDSGPRFQRALKLGNQVRVEFAEAERGLDARVPLAGFELAADGGPFVPAEALIDGSAVTVSSSEVPQPARIRYAWSNNPTASLFEKDGLPAAPFQAEVRERQ